MEQLQYLVLNRLAWMPQRGQFFFSCTGWCFYIKRRIKNIPKCFALHLTFKLFFKGAFPFQMFTTGIFPYRHVK